MTKHADTLIGQGDPRSRGQIMADTMVERLTGQAVATDVSVEINLVMTDHALFNAGGDKPDATSHADEPAVLIGHGPIPAELARRLVGDPSDETAMFIRRLYTDSSTGRLIAMDSARRCFTPNQRHLLVVRDQTCRTPWCDAPIRHADHVESAQHNGPTSITNGQGLCQACNHAKQAPGWQSHPAPSACGAGEYLGITTPTGHHYRSHPPDPPGDAREGIHSANTIRQAPAAA